MEIKTARLLYFSPTGTGHTVISAVARGMGVMPVDSSITLPHERRGQITVEEDILIACAPVYGGGIPQIAFDYFKTVNTNGKPAVLLCIYGNRAYEDALHEMKESLAGAKIVAAAAFLGKHSVETKNMPVTGDRPNAIDVAEAEEFGRKIIDKLRKDIEEIEVPTCTPSKASYTGKQEPYCPEADPEKCIDCHKCAYVCPTGAIRKDSAQMTNAKKCIHCMACVRVCPTQIRQSHSEQTSNILKWLSDNFKDIIRPNEFFI